MTTKDCAVCFENKSIDEFGFLPCTHSFCTFCIQHLRQLICPLCRHPFNEYENNGHSHSAPATTNLIHSYMARRPSIDSVDDLYLEYNMGNNNRLTDRMRRRLRRRRRRLNSDRPRRRSEEVEEMVFQIDDILPADNAENTNEEKNEETKEENTSRNNRRRDNWQILRNQRSRYSR